jgi:hypothetical protein
VPRNDDPKEFFNKLLELELRSQRLGMLSRIALEALVKLLIDGRWYVTTFFASS